MELVVPRWYVRDVVRVDAWWGPLELRKRWRPGNEVWKPFRPGRPLVRKRRRPGETLGPEGRTVGPVLRLGWWPG